MTTTIIVTNYFEYQQEISAIRHRVFVEEQKITAAEVWDQRDAICQHVLIRHHGETVAAGRIDIEKSGKVGRVAVLSSVRKYGFGRRIMAALEQQARQSKRRKGWFHAQISAIGFYQKLGYQVVGKEFEEAGIIHRKMEKNMS